MFSNVAKPTKQCERSDPTPLNIALRLWLQCFPIETTSKTPIKDECEECEEFPESRNASQLRGGGVELIHYYWAPSSINIAALRKACIHMTTDASSVFMLAVFHPRLVSVFTNRMWLTVNLWVKGAFGVSAFSVCAVSKACGYCTNVLCNININYDKLRGSKSVQMYIRNQHLCSVMQFGLKSVTSNVGCALWDLIST